MNIKKFDIKARFVTLGYIIKLMCEDRIDWQYPHQDDSFVGASRESDLIESILLGIPLPFFCFFDMGDDTCQIMQGKRKAMILKDFIIDKNFRLQDLRILTQLEGYSYDDLPRDLLRRIEDMQVAVYNVGVSASDTDKSIIFSRIRGW